MTVNQAHSLQFKYFQGRWLKISCLMSILKCQCHSIKLKKESWYKTMINLSWFYNISNWFVSIENILLYQKPLLVYNSNHIKYCVFGLWLTYDFCISDIYNLVVQQTLIIFHLKLCCCTEWFFFFCRAHHSSGIYYIRQWHIFALCVSKLFLVSILKQQISYIVLLLYLSSRGISSVE